MFDAELKNAGHVSGTKMATFVMDQGSRMNLDMKAMKALIVSCMELFLVMVELSKDGKTSSSYSNLTPQDVVEIQKAAVGGGNQPMEEKDQMEDITASRAPHVSTTEVVVPNATLISSMVGKETMDGCHVVEVTPSSLPLTFHVVVRALPPLAPEIPPSSELATPLALDVSKTGDHVVVVPGPMGTRCKRRCHLLHFWQRTEQTATKSGNRRRWRPR